MVIVLASFAAVAIVALFFYFYGESKQKIKSSHYTELQKIREKKGRKS